MVGWITEHLTEKANGTSGIRKRTARTRLWQLSIAAWKPNRLNPEHAHEFDARLLVFEGAMTIAAEGSERTYRAGESFTMAAGCRHSERSGPDGARYLAGRRYAKA